MIVRDIRWKGYILNMNLKEKMRKERRLAR